MPILVITQIISLSFLSSVGYPTCIHQNYNTIIYLFKKNKTNKTPHLYNSLRKLKTSQDQHLGPKLHDPCHSSNTFWLHPSHPLHRFLPGVTQKSEEQYFNGPKYTTPKLSISNVFTIDCLLNQLLLLIIPLS